jgi:hypothetical protein
VPRFSLDVQSGIHALASYLLGSEGSLRTNIGIERRGASFKKDQGRYSHTCRVFRLIGCSVIECWERIWLARRSVKCTTLPDPNLRCNKLESAAPVPKLGIKHRSAGANPESLLNISIRGNTEGPHAPDAPWDAGDRLLECVQDWPANVPGRKGRYWIGLDPFLQP